MVRAPPVLVVKFLERFKRLPESATVVVYVAVWSAEINLPELWVVEEEVTFSSLPVVNPVSANAKTLPVAWAEVKEKVPEPWMNPVKPEIAPAAETSQEEESMATVAELLPIAVTPVEDNVVKAPLAAVVAPIWVELIPVAVVLKVEAPVPEVMVKLFVP
jgi:hypothetical protein